MDKSRKRGKMGKENVWNHGHFGAGRFLGNQEKISDYSGLMGERPIG